jgi:hypothetical protein
LHSPVNPAALEGFLHLFGTMKTKIIAGLIIYSASLVLNAAVLFVLALPFKWMWALTLTPVFAMPRLDYFHSLAFLGLITVIRVVVSGIKLSATLKDGSEI